MEIRPLAQVNKIRGVDQTKGIAELKCFGESWVSQSMVGMEPPPFRRFFSIWFLPIRFEYRAST